MTASTISSLTVSTQRLLSACSNIKEIIISDSTDINHYVILQVGYDLKEEIERKFDKWQEPPPVKQVKPLPAPLDGQRKKRGGRRYRTCQLLFMCTSCWADHRLNMEMPEVQNIYRVFKFRSTRIKTRAAYWSTRSLHNLHLPSLDPTISSVCITNTAFLFSPEGIERWRSASASLRSGNMPTGWPLQRSVDIFCHASCISHLYTLCMLLFIPVLFMFRP